MEIIELKSKAVNVKEYKARTAVESDAKRIIKEDTLIVENGKPIVLYKHIDWCDTNELRKACHKVKYNVDTRLPKASEKGIMTRSAIFGYRPRIPLRQDFCSSTTMAYNNPSEHQVITDFASNLTAIYKEYFPDTFELHQEKVNAVLPEWKIQGSVFTSGIINKNNPLQYHHDTGNFKGVLSNMVAFKDGVSGGRLVMPEYNIKLEISDNTVSIFDGQSILHGVTPIIKAREDSYRYTIVYYSLEQMWKCETIKDEVKRIRRIKKEREMKRLQNNQSNGV